MDEVSARADVADAVGDSGLAVKVPRDEVERILSTDEEVDLVLDVVRTNGEREERRIFLAWDREALRHLVDQGGEQIVLAIDPKSLQEALDADVEAHGFREMGATLAIAVTALGGAGTAGAAVSQDAFQPGVTDFPSITATVDTQSFQAGVTDFPSAAAGEAVTAADTQPGGPGDLRPQTAVAPEVGMPRAMPSDYAALQGDESATLRRDPGAMPTGAAISEPTERGIENVRASQPPPVEAPDATSGIESVRVGGTAVPDPSSGIEAVRAERAPADVGDGGGTAIAAPSTGAAVAIAGGAMLTIAAAAFALRRKREPGLA